MTAGRPSSYTQAIGAEICEHLVTGKSLASWCAIAGHASYSSVCRWLQSNEEFRENYTRARDAQADFLAEEILEISDAAEHDTVNTPEGPRPNTEWISRSRLRIDARKWYAGKLRPKVYGDRIQQDHSGEVTIKSLAERMRTQKQAGDESGGFA